MATTKTKMAAPADSKAALRVVSLSPLGTFRRAGFVFTAEPTVLKLSEVSEAQADAIKNTSMLDVSETTL